MAIFPRPVHPKSALADLREMFAPDRPHRWTILALSMTLTAIMIWGFYLDSKPFIPYKQDVHYVESWMADRLDSDIIRRQMQDLAGYEDSLLEAQKEFQGVADKLGIEWREEEERSRAQRQDIIAQIQVRLEERLAAALEREVAEGKPASQPFKPIITLDP